MFKNDKKDMGINLNVSSQVDKLITLNPVTIAVEKGHEACLHLLQEAGCNLEQADIWGQTSVHRAVRKGHEGCLRFLKDNGCDLGKADVWDQTPAQLAARKGHEGCLRFLKDNGCDLGKDDDYGQTLHIRQLYMDTRAVCVF